jgi:hypothetical protein
MTAQDAFYSKLFHVVVIFLIALYVVFVQKSQDTVESVSRRPNLARPFYLNNSSHQKG